MARTPKRATKNAARRMVLNALSKDDDMVVEGDEESVPPDLINFLPSTRDWPCADQMLRVEMWTTHLRTVCLSHSLSTGPQVREAAEGHRHQQGRAAVP